MTTLAFWPSARCKSWCRCAVLALTLLFWCSRDSNAAPVGACKDVKPDPNSPDSYALHNDRCEGMYLQDYAASVVPYSVTIGKVKVPKLGSMVKIKWDAVAVGGELDLVARNFKCAPHYQMRAKVAAPASTYSWPSSIAAKNSIDSLGVQVRDGNGLYVPARAQDASAAQEYEISFCTSEPLSNVWIKVYDPEDNPVHAARIMQADAGPVAIRVPTSLTRSKTKYRVALSSGAISAGLRFEAP